MADMDKERLRAMELVIHSQTAAMRHLAQDVRYLAETIQEMKAELLQGGTPLVPGTSEAEKLLSDVFEKFSANLHDHEARTSAFQDTPKDKG